MMFLTPIRAGWLLVFVACLLTSSLAGAEFPPVEKLPERAELPDALTMFDETKVTTREQWYEQRRPELKALFAHYMYGNAPPAPKVAAKVTKTDGTVLGGKATLKEIEISFPELSDDAPRIHLALFVPNERKGPVPVFLALNKCGNHEVIADEAVTIHADAWRHQNCGDELESKRGDDANFWCVDQLIGRGYAFATYHESEIDPDTHDFTDGIHPHYPDLPGPKESRWGTIAAWAWGLQRCVDYLVTDDAINAKQIAVTGHSRRGKTALLCGAFDERIALVVPHQSGTGGAALSRDNDQETVERINRVFPHWFNDTFTEFNHREAKLPVDQHLLMALVAPRALLDTEGIQDKWANYSNGLRSLQGADKVYKFLGAPGMVDDGMIEGESLKGRNVGNLLQYRLDTKHTLNCDYWEAILDFADQQFGRTGSK